jgi:hypothetical protein
MGHYDECREEAGMDRVRAETADQRTAKMSSASLGNSASVKQPSLIAQLHGRINDIRQNALDCASTVHSAADSITGAVPEAEQSGIADMDIPTGGALGELFQEVASLEFVMSELRSQVRRLSSIA